jgi:hypothetical protein
MADGGSDELAEVVATIVLLPFVDRNEYGREEGGRDDAHAEVIVGHASAFGEQGPRIKLDKPPPGLH